MKYTMIGPALYMDKVGSYFTEDQGQMKRLETKVTDAEDRYVKRHLKGGKYREKN